MPKFRHLAIVCKDPAKMAEWYEKAFDLKRVRQNPKNGVTELTDGDFHLVLLAETFLAHDAVPWHFGFEMTMEEIEERRPRLESMGANYSDGLRDGRSVEVYVRDPEGHRVDMAPYWPTAPGAQQREEEYRAWERVPASRP
jgi:catechol 2,3-dioxygenase-like lactoylglutathione lyase family enzyme